MRISRSSLLLACAAVLAFVPSIRAQAMVRVFDPRRPYVEHRTTRADRALLERVALPAARRRWAGTEDNCAEGFQVEDAAAGAFTRAGARQRAFLYTYCRPSRVLALGGITIVEGGRVVAHVLRDGIEHSIYAIADVDRNGRHEMVLVDGSTNQGHTWQRATLLELEPGGRALRSLGTFWVRDDDCGTLNEDPREEIQAVYARPGRRPRFFQQTYLGNCSRDRPRWTRHGALKPVTPER